MPLLVKLGWTARAFLYYKGRHHSTQGSCVCLDLVLIVVSFASLTEGTESESAAPKNKTN